MINTMIGYAFGFITALAATYFSYRLNRKTQKEETARIKGAIRILFIASVNTFQGYLYDIIFLKITNPKWDNPFWNQNQIAIAKYFPLECKDFALVVSDIIDPLNSINQITYADACGKIDNILLRLDTVQ